MSADIVDRLQLMLHARLADEDSIIRDAAAEIVRLRGEVPYDRELIARMLQTMAKSSNWKDYTFAAVEEQAALLRAADNADAAGVRTASIAPAEAKGDAMVSGECSRHCMSTMSCDNSCEPHPQPADGGAVAFVNTGDSEAQSIADGERLNCPACGGSGHVDDTHPAGDALGAVSSPWRSIFELTPSDDLYWFTRGDTVDGPRQPAYDDCDYWDYFAPCTWPALPALRPSAGEGKGS